MKKFSLLQTSNDKMSMKQEDNNHGNSLYQKPNNKISMKPLFLCVQVPLLLFLLHCPRQSISQQELTEARLQIALARDEGATRDLATRKSYRQAQEGLMGAHSFLRDEKYDQAQKSARHAIDQAMSAREIVLPKRLKPARERGSKAIELLNNSNIEEISPDDLANAQQAFENAESYHKQGKAFQAKAKDAAEPERTTLRRKALGLLRSAYLSYSRVRELADKLNQIVKARRLEIAALLKAAREELALAKNRGATFIQLKEPRNDIEAAQENYDKRRYGAAEKTLNAVREKLSDLIAELQEVHAKGFLARAKTILERAEAGYELTKKQEMPEDSELLKFLDSEIKEELTTAQEAKIAAEEFLNQKQYEEAVKESEDIIRLSQVVLEQISIRMLGKAKTSVEDAKASYREAISEEKTAGSKRTKTLADILDNIKEEIAIADRDKEEAEAALNSKDYNDSIQESINAILLSQGALERLSQDMVVAVKAVTEKPAPLMKTKSAVKSYLEDIGNGWKRWMVRKKRPADCLWCISSTPQIYNEGYLWRRIYRANKQKIKNPDLIYPGQVFFIPPLRGPITKPPLKKKTYQVGEEVIEDGQPEAKESPQEVIE